MHYNFMPVHFAGILGLGAPELIVILIVMAFPIFVIAIVATALFFKHRQRQMWHETARMALEKGQPLPPAPVGNLHALVRVRSEQNDIRAGLILIAAGIGIAVFFNGLGSRDMVGVGAIPGFIGVALLLFGLLSPKKSPTENRPPQP
jgi:hypothetical protein